MLSYSMGVSVDGSIADREWCETDPRLRGDALRAAFADVWCALPKVVFSRTLDSVHGTAPRD